MSQDIKRIRNSPHSSANDLRQCIDVLLAELTKEREARQKGADNVIALYHGWNDMDISPHYSAQTIASIIADVAAHAGIVIEGVNEDMLEGNEPNEGL
jgi:hypothetical protein